MTILDVEIRANFKVTLGFVAGLPFDVAAAARTRFEGWSLAGNHALHRLPQIISVGQ